MSNPRKLVDFDHAFSQYARNWFAENEQRYENVEAMELDMPEVYLQWLTLPQDFLDGAAPDQYFKNGYSAVELVEWMVEYVRSGVPVPDPLMDGIVECGIESVPPLTLILDNSQDEQLRISAINLLREIDDGLPLYLLLDLIEDSLSRDEVAEAAAEALQVMGPEILEPIFERLNQGVGDYAASCFLDVLSHQAHDERIYRWLSEYFLAGGDLQLYASLLGQYGDDRAIELLHEAMRQPELPYLEYATMHMAIEQLGGTLKAEDERDYAGDPAFEAMRMMEES